MAPSFLSFNQVSTLTFATLIVCLEHILGLIVCFKRLGRCLFCQPCFEKKALKMKSPL